MGRNGIKGNRNSRIQTAVFEALEGRQLMALTVPTLNSLPGAPKTIYLDFDGDAATDWNDGEDSYRVNGPGAGTNDAVPGLNWDADPNNFSTAEDTAIRTIHAIVAEKYSPFNVNVTTVDPGNVNNGVTLKIIFGGRSTDWMQPGATSLNSGIAPIGGFMDASLPNTCYVFADQYANNAFFLGNIAAHEAGHSFGLVHERWNRDPAPVGNNNYPEYYLGDTTRSPIMGDSANNSVARGIWWKTNNWAGQSSPDGAQDELALLTGVGGALSYRNDDYDFYNVGSLYINPNGGFAETKGVIHQRSETDPFRFTATGTTATIYIDNAANAGMLAPTGTLQRTSDAGPVAYSLVESNTRATITAVGLQPGVSYTLLVGSQGDYGDIGQYRISGQMQTFTSYDAATRTVTVSGYSGSNNLIIEGGYNPNNSTYNNLIVRNNVGTGGSLQYFPMSEVDRLVVRLGNGDDTLKIAVPSKPGSNIAIPTTVDMGGGNDTMRVTNPGSFTTYAITDNRITSLIANTYSKTIDFNDVQTLEVEGSGDNDQFNVTTLGLATKVKAWGYGGDDKMTIGAGVINGTGQHTWFYGGGNNDFLIMDAATNTATTNMSVLDDFVATNAQGYQRESHFDTEVENVWLVGGSGNDGFSVDDLAASTRVVAFGMAGNDGLSMGISNDYSPLYAKPFSAHIKGNVGFLGGPGADSMYIDDRDYSGSVNYTINDSGIRSTASGVVNIDSVESNTLIGCGGATSIYTLNTTAASPIVNMTIIGGTKTDGFNLDSFPGNATINGGAGADYFYVSNPTNGLPLLGDVMLDGGGGNGDFIQFKDTSNTYLTIMGLNDKQATLGNGIVRYNDIDGMHWDLGQFADAFFIASTPAGMPVTVKGNNGDDSLALGREFLTSENTLDQIRSRVTFEGGAGTDRIFIYDQATTSNETWSFDRGQITRNGPAGFARAPGQLVEIAFDGAANEGIVLNGGAGNDTINLLGNASLVTLKGGEGDDQFVVANGADAGTALFDGQAGTDTLGVTGKPSTTVHWDVTDAQVRHGIGIMYMSYTYMNYAGLEGITLDGTNGVANHVAVASTQIPLTVNGAAGDDTFYIGQTRKTDAIRARIDFNGAGGNDELFVDDRNNAVGKVAHLDQNSIGAASGDTLFGVGGMIYAPGMTSTTLRLGSGDDVVYAQPSIYGPTTIDAGEGNDALMLGLATAQNYVVGEGAVTSDNLFALSFAGFEDQVIDDVAPYVIGATFNYDGPVQSIEVQFSEDVSQSLSASTLTLINQTSGEQVAPSDIAYEYDTTTNTARFTFPTLSNGALADGNYAGSILAGLPDAFGNVTDAQFDFDFFVLSGDANHDGSVDVADLGILASNWQQSGTLFSQGDFNYDGVVNVADLGILASNWQGQRPMPSLPFAGSRKSSSSPRLVNRLA